MKQPLGTLGAACVCVALVLVLCGGARPAEVSHRETPLVHAIKRVRPSVVNITSQKAVVGQLDANAGKMSGMGTGVVVDERGYVLTNYHVIEDVSSIRIKLVDGSSYPAEVVARDPSTDLALLRVRPSSPMAVMPMGRSDDLMYGETVIAIGNAYGYEHTITMGVVSELHRNVSLSATQSYHDLIQTDASINPGNSGGPLINADGEMIGLNVAIRAGAQGIGFAIPVDQIKEVLANLMSVRRLRGAWHGIASTHGAGGGAVVVREVEPGSPAEHAGLRPGDALLAVEGREIRYGFDLERALLDKSAKDLVSVRVSRPEGEREFRLGLAPAPDREIVTVSNDDPVWGALGLRLAPYGSPQELRRYSADLRGGLLVREVRPGSPAEESGLSVGDVLVGMNQLETRTEGHVRYVLQLQRKDGVNPLAFHVVRGGRMYRGWLNLTP